MGTIAVTAGFWQAYRWAEPPPPADPGIFQHTGPDYSMRLENGSYTEYREGKKVWTISADRIDLSRLPGSAITNVQMAEMTRIHSGTLFGKQGAGGTFAAEAGRYTIGNSDALDPVISQSYYVSWSLRLTRKVEVTLQTGDRLEAPELTILALTNRRTAAKENRLTCDSGVTVTHRKVVLHANSARYDMDQHLVECLNGVTVTLPQGRAQAPRLFWSPSTQTIRCPETLTGVLKGMPFSAEDTLVDTKHGTVSANRVTADLRNGDQQLPVFR